MTCLTCLGNDRFLSRHNFSAGRIASGLKFVSDSEIDDSIKRKRGSALDFDLLGRQNKFYLFPGALYSIHM